jgi:hypothetical protein
MSRKISNDRDNCRGQALLNQAGRTPFANDLGGGRPANEARARRR